MKEKVADNALQVSSILLEITPMGLVYIFVRPNFHRPLLEVAEWVWRLYRVSFKFITLQAKSVKLLLNDSE